jgi:hypothetical protein
MVVPLRGRPDAGLLASMGTARCSQRNGRRAATSAPPAFDDSLQLSEGTSASAAFIFVLELSREIIGKGSYFERGPTAARVNGVQLDSIKLVVGKDRDELTGLEFGAAHPSRGERYAEPRFGAGDNAFGRGDLYWPFDRYGRCPHRVRETPAGSAGETRAENAIVPGEVGGRLRRSPARKVCRRGNGESRSAPQQSRAEPGIGQMAQPQGHIGAMMPPRPQHYLHFAGVWGSKSAWFVY